MKRTNKLLGGILAAALTLSAAGGGALAAEGDRLPLIVNGQETAITVEEYNGGYLVPVRSLGEYLGYTVEWQPCGQQCHVGKRRHARHPYPGGELLSGRHQAWRAWWV